MRHGFRQCRLNLTVSLPSCCHPISGRETHTSEGRHTGILPLPRRSECRTEMSQSSDDVDRGPSISLAHREANGRAKSLLKAPRGVAFGAYQATTSITKAPSTPTNPTWVEPQLPVTAGEQVIRHISGSREGTQQKRRVQRGVPERQKHPPHIQETKLRKKCHTEQRIGYLLPKDRDLQQTWPPGRCRSPASRPG